MISIIGLQKFCCNRSSANQLLDDVTAKVMFGSMADGSSMRSGICNASLLEHRGNRWITADRESNTNRQDGSVERDAAVPAVVAPFRRDLSQL